MFPRLLSTFLKKIAKRIKFTLLHLTIPRFCAIMVKLNAAVAKSADARDFDVCTYDSMSAIYPQRVPVKKLTE